MRVRVLKLMYREATDTEGSKLVIIDTATKDRVVLPWDYRYSSVLEYATAYISDRGIEILGEDSYYIVVKVDQPRIKD